MCNATAILHEWRWKEHDAWLQYWSIWLDHGPPHNSKWTWIVCGNTKCIFISYHFSTLTRHKGVKFYSLAKETCLSPIDTIWYPRFLRCQSVSECGINSFRPGKCNNIFKYIIFKHFVVIDMNNTWYEHTLSICLSLNGNEPHRTYINIGSS